MNRYKMKGNLACYYLDADRATLYLVHGLVTCKTFSKVSNTFRGINDPSIICRQTAERISTKCESSFSTGLPAIKFNFRNSDGNMFNMGSSLSVTSASSSTSIFIIRSFEESEDFFASIFRLTY